MNPKLPRRQALSILAASPLAAQSGAPAMDIDRKSVV